MITLNFTRPPDSPFRILCLGAHSDDIEIGCGGTVLRLLEENPAAEVSWVVLGAAGSRKTEAVESAKLFLAGAKKRKSLSGNSGTDIFPRCGPRSRTISKSSSRNASPI